MAVGGFVAPELDPNAANAAQAEAVEGKGNWKGSWGWFCFLTMWQCDGILGPAHCWTYGLVENKEYNDPM